MCANEKLIIFVFLFLLCGCVSRDEDRQWRPVRLLPLVDGISKGGRREAVSISGITEDALVFSSPGSVESPELEIGPGTVLLVDYAVPERRARGNMATLFRVRIVPGSEEHQSITAFEEKVPRTRESPPAWKFASIDLPVERHGSYRIVLEVAKVKGHAFAGGVWSSVVMAPPLPAPEPRKNVVLITMDTTRADHLSLYGYERDTTPFLEELGRQSTVFTRAYTASTWTLPSHATIFTGLYPSEHQAISMADMQGGNPLGDAHLTLAEVLLREGFFTMGIAGGGFLRRPFNLSQGFLYYSDRWKGISRSWVEANRIALDWLDRMDGRPFFLFINYFDPHAPYNPRGFGAKEKRVLRKAGIDMHKFQPTVLKKKGVKSLPGDVVAALIRLYDQEIVEVDGAIRNIVNALAEKNLLEHTLICIVGDHGESFGDHGLWGHGGRFVESQARVPLLIFDPGETGYVVDSPVSTVLVPHMIFSRIGVPTPENFRTEGPVYGSRFIPPGSMRFLLEWPYKYLVRFDNKKPRKEGAMFRLDVDPGETRDLGASEDGEYLRMEQAFSAFIAQIEAPPELSAVAEVEKSPATKDEDLREQLKALGYID